MTGKGISKSFYTHLECEFKIIKIYTVEFKYVDSPFIIVVIVQVKLVVFPNVFIKIDVLYI